MKKIVVFLVLFLNGCYTQYTVTEPVVRREVVVVRNDYYHTPYSPIYPYSLYRREYHIPYYPYNRYYFVPEYRWYYVYTTPQPTRPQTRRVSGVGSVETDRPIRRGTERRVEGSRNNGRREAVRNGSERVERKRTERRVE